MKTIFLTMKDIYIFRLLWNPKSHLNPHKVPRWITNKFTALIRQRYKYNK